MPTERFPKVKRGQYRIVLEKGDFNPFQYEEEHDGFAGKHNQRIAKKLMNYGMSEKEALRISSAFSDTIIRHHTDVFDWEIEQGKTVPNPGGYLRTRIMENYNDPVGFIPRAERTRLARKNKDLNEARRNQFEQQKVAVKVAEEKHDERITLFWSPLYENGRAEAERKALSFASRSQAEWMKRDGQLKQATIQNLLYAYAEKMLGLNHSPTAQK